MTCTSCGDKPKGSSKGFPKAVVEINNPESLVLLRKVVIPVSMGTEEDVPPAIGKYFNVLLQYESNGHIYLYSSDGIPTAIEANIPQEVLDRIDQLEIDVDLLETGLANEAEARETADNNLQQEIDDLKNSPDVVDIVATYADLQAYDTSSLGDKDVIRVLRDETHEGQSDYYRWSTSTQTWTFIGTVGDYYTKQQIDDLLDEKQDELVAGQNIHITDESGNLVISADSTTYTAGEAIDITNSVISATNTGKAKILTTADYNYPTNNPTSVALWLLEDGYYTCEDSSVVVLPDTSTSSISPGAFLIGGTTERKMVFYLTPDGNSRRLYSTRTSDGTSLAFYNLLGTNNVVDNLTSSAGTLPLSANQGRVLKGLIDAIPAPTTYTAGTGLDLTGTEFSVDFNDVQGKLTAGDNITIQDESGDLVISATDTTYTAGTGINISNGVISATSTGPTVVQTTGSSTTDVMSQNAVTDLIYTDDTYYKQIAIGTDAQTGDASNGNAYSVAIGTSANAGIQAGSSDNAAEATAIGSGAVARGKYGTAIGSHAKAGQDGVFRANGCVGIGSYANSFGTAIAIGGGTGKNSQSTPNIAKASYASDDGAIAIGVGAVVSSNSGKKGSIALGAGATVLNQTGVMNIGTYDTSYGYSNSGYRLLTGLYDPQTAHDAATKGYVDASLPATFTTNEWNALWA